MRLTTVVQLHIPPLRARGSDILLLARQFLAKAVARTSKQIERAVALTRFQEIMQEDLPDRISGYEIPGVSVQDMSTDYITLAELETRYIKTALKSSKGNKTQAAKVLGVDRRTLYRKLERLAQC